MSAQIERIEIEFALPVDLTEAERRELCQLVDRIARRHEPCGMVHWQSGCGSKPLLSKADARFLGKDVRDDAPETGEPEWDDTVFYIETCARVRYEKPITHSDED